MLGRISLRWSVSHPVASMLVAPRCEQPMRGYGQRRKCAPRSQAGFTHSSRTVRDGGVSYEDADLSVAQPVLVRKQLACSVAWVMMALACVGYNSSCELVWLNGYVMFSNTRKALCCGFSVAASASSDARQSTMHGMRGAWSWNDLRRGSSKHAWLH